METREIFGRPCRILRSGTPTCHIYWPVMAEEDLETAERLLIAAGRPFLITAFTVEHWNDDLSPWPADPVFGDAGFAGKGYETLRWLEKTAAEERELPRYVGGYSLGGLFALLALCETDLFAGAVSGSGSFWFPGWQDYMRSRPAPDCRTVLFRLGDREERSRNPDFARVGGATRELIDILRRSGVYTELTMEPGGHFQDPMGRMVRGFVRLLELADA